MNINELTYQIRGAIFEVYNHLGPGLLESVYEEALIEEFKLRELKVERQVSIPVQYKGRNLNTHLVLDLLVEGQVIIELKSVLEMHNVFFKQLLSYLRLAQLHVGFLVNFKTDHIDESIYRVVN